VYSLPVNEEDDFSLSIYGEGQGEGEGGVRINSK